RRIVLLLLVSVASRYCISWRRCRGGWSLRLWHRHLVRLFRRLFAITHMNKGVRNRLWDVVDVLWWSRISGHWSLQLGFRYCNCRWFSTAVQNHIHVMSEFL